MPPFDLAHQLGHSDLRMLHEVYYTDHSAHRLAMVDKFAPDIDVSRTMLSACTLETRSAMKHGWTAAKKAVGELS